METNLDMTKLIRRLEPRRLLLIAGLTASCGAAGAFAAPALATNEYFECSGGCFVTNGPENFIKNTFGINHEGKWGNCTTTWRNNGGGNYTKMAYECVLNGETAKACSASEVHGHGEVETVVWSYLRGRQDNFKNCE